MRTNRIQLKEPLLEQVRYTGLTEDKLNQLASWSSEISLHIDEIVEKLYDDIFMENHLRRIIENYSTLTILKTKQKQYLQEILNCIIDQDYVENRYKTGAVHSKIGLDIKWYMATCNKYIEVLSKIIKKLAPDEAVDLMNTIQAIFNFDTQLILESYKRLEVDRAANPLIHELNKIARLIGFKDEDRIILETNGGILSFSSAKIIERFFVYFFERSEQKRTKGFDPDLFIDYLQDLLNEFFQDRVYLKPESYFRTVRGWSRKVIDGTIDEHFFLLVFQSLGDAVEEVLLLYNNADKTVRYVSKAFNKLIQFTQILLNELIKPYALLKQFNFLDVYAYEISTTDFGRITWIDEQMRSMLKEINGDEPVGKRCYEVIAKRNFLCPNCPTQKKNDEAVLFLVKENDRQSYYKLQRISRLGIFGLNRALMIMQDTTQEGKIMFDTIDRLLQLAEFKDDNTGNHVKRIAILSSELAKLAGCDKTFVSNIRTAAEFHDIGKVGIPDSILNKPGKLNEQERKSIETHTEIGHKILADLDLPVIQMAARIARTHHEWWNGEGYPLGLKETEIPLEGRIVAIVDVYDALLSKRCYKTEIPPEQVKQIMKGAKGIQFDPELTELFLKMWDEFFELRKNMMVDN